MESDSLKKVRRRAIGLGALVLAACARDETTQPVPLRGGESFIRYVALGGSMAAGFQSAGLTTSSQQEAYPVLLARRADASMIIPGIPAPGCPVPMTAPLVPATAASSCASVTAVSGSRGQNVAVPGARADKLNTLPSLPAPSIHTALLGSRTQVAIARSAQATFVSIETGDQDVLRAALLGQLGLIGTATDSVLTTVASFQSSVSQIASWIAGITTLRGAVVIGVVDPVPLLPVLQPGAFFFVARNAGGQYSGKSVNANCSPVTPLGQPNPLSASLVSFSVLFDATVPEIDCDPAQQNGAYLLTPAEQDAIRARVTAFNQILASTADAHGWLYLDPNPLLAAFLNTTDGQGRYQHVRRCQTLAAASTAAEIQTATLMSCPVSGTTAAPNQFGSLFTFDANSFSGEAHLLLVNALVPVINTRYGTSLGLTP